MVCEGYVFTGVCLSTGDGGLSLCPGGSLSGGFLSGRPSWTERHTPDREKPSGQRPPCTVMGGRYASYWNAFLFPMHTCILFLFQAIQIYIRIFYYFKVLNFSVACLFAVLLHGILAEVDILDYKVAKTKKFKSHIHYILYFRQDQISAPFTMSTSTHQTNTTTHTCLDTTTTNIRPWRELQPTLQADSPTT